MGQQQSVKHEYLEFIPEHLQTGTLYISLKYKTASHLCCCGCGYKVVTPLNAAKWTLTDHGKSVSLFPSVGNWSFPCKSHYWITHGQIKWAAKMSDKQIAHVRKMDRADAELHASTNEVVSNGLISQLWLWIRNLFK
ncbi:MAG: hypothetical protein CTY35_09900 [Methylotenera sp.]|nr:MAG: hypothetical protein CTY35_09900 [Methylotenera sp.]PPD18646.1 MAG: hypothetical protein CTY27_01125 [Methylotenera sp.]